MATTSTIPQIPVTTVLPRDDAYGESGSTLGGSSKFLLQNVTYKVANVSALRALNVTNAANNLSIEIFGLSSPNDGGQGFFYYNSSGTGTDDGINIIQPTVGPGRWFRISTDIINPYSVGTNASSGDNSAFLSKRALVNHFVTGYHAYRDEDTYVANDVGFNAKSSFDSIYSASGSSNWNHLHSYQARINYSGSGVCDEIAGYTSQITHNG